MSLTPGSTDVRLTAVRLCTLLHVRYDRPHRKAPFDIRAGVIYTLTQIGPGLCGYTCGCGWHPVPFQWSSARVPHPVPERSFRRLHTRLLYTARARRRL